MATRPLTQSRSLAAALNAQALGALWSSTGFSTTIPLDGIKVMPGQAISGALAFTAGASPQPGGTCYLRLTADGVHTPSFPGFAEHGASAGFDGRAGAINLLTLWHDGTGGFYAVAQPVAPPATAVVASATIANASPGEIVVAFSVSLDPAHLPASSAFAITDSGGADAVTAAAIVEGQLVLTKSRATMAADAVTLAYAPPAADPLTDINGNLVSGFGGRAVANQVNGSNWLRFTVGAHLVESANAAGGFDYAADATITGSYYFAGEGGYSAKRLPAGADGWVQVTTAANGIASGPYLGLATGTAPQSFGDTQYGLYQNGASWQVNGLNVVTGVQCSAGDVIRLRRAGATIFGEVSKDGGTSWTVVGSGAGTAAALTPFIQTGQTGSAGGLYQPVGSATLA